MHYHCLQVPLVSVAHQWIGFLFLEVGVEMEVNVSLLDVSFLVSWRPVEGAEYPRGAGDHPLDFHLLVMEV